MDELFLKVVDVLKKYGMTKKNNDDIVPEDYLIFTENSVIEVISPCLISISFHVSIKPDLSATIVLILNEIKDIKIDIAEMFTYDPEGEQLISGLVAEKFQKNLDNKNIIMNFVEEQRNIHILNNVENHDGYVN